MILSSLRTNSFRNLADEEKFTGAKNVFLIGENGQGKTNFLEAVYFCSYASSFRTAKYSELVCNEENKKDYSAEVKIENSINEKIFVKFENGKKSIYINGKRTEDRKDLLSVVPCIVFCHEDMEFVNGSPERRRWFFDQTLSLYDPVYLDDLHRYKKVLKTRNAILRDFAQHKTENPETVLDAIDPQFAMYGQKLMKKREKTGREFSEIFSPLYEEVSGISGITVQYICSWKSDDIVSFLKEKRAPEMASGLSLSGPHRDRYVFNYKGSDFTINASTGQRRLLALLLRAAQAGRFSAETRQNPVLLLDDVLLEMDGEKRRRFLSVLPAYDQAFYTFLPEEPYQRYQKDDTLVYFVKNGKLFLT